MSLTNSAGRGSRVAGRGLYVAGAGLMSRMQVEIRGAGFDVAGAKWFRLKFKLEFEVND